jgi:hypothetical protein
VGGTDHFGINGCSGSVTRAVVIVITAVDEFYVFKLCDIIYSGSSTGIRTGI